MSSWVSVLHAAGYAIGEAAVLCRGSGLLAKLSTETSQIGQSAVKHFASAAIEREQAADISKVLEHCAKGVLAIVSGLPDSFISDIKNMRGDADVKTIRRLMWSLIRTPTTGVPLATLAAKSSWLNGLKKNLNSWLTLVEQETKFKREPTWNKRVTAAELPKTGPLIGIDIGQHDWSALRCGTVHSAKGEGIPAVMYLTNKGDVDALVAGTGDEEGRIGFVAVTRGRDLLVVAIPSGTSDETIVKLKPVFGYLHRNHEKLGENVTYLASMPYTDRLDYLCSMSNNWAYALAVEKLAGQPVPEPTKQLVKRPAPGGEGFVLDPYSILVPFLVFAIGVSHGAQKMNGIMQDVGCGTHKYVAARYTFRRLFLAGLTALIADVVGFAVLMVIDIPVIRDLAMTASIGVGVLILTNLMLLPERMQLYFPLAFLESEQLRQLILQSIYS